MRRADDSLFLWQDRYTVYQYDCGTGRYQGAFSQREHERDFPAGEPPAQRRPVSEFPDGALFYDSLTVYRKTAEGNIPLVSRSGWVRLFYFKNIWLLGILSVIGQSLFGGISLKRSK